MLINIDFSNTHVVIFGGTSGINLGIAQAFCTNGANVTVVSRSADKVSAAVAALSMLPRGAARGFCADVRDADTVSSVAEAAAQAFGPIDVLVSGAAGNFLCEAKKMSANGFKAVVDIDLLGTFNAVSGSWRHLRKPGASVINVTAPQAVVPMRYQSHVAAAKAGVDQLTRVLALEWGAEGVRVNAISPGPVSDTEGFRKLMGPDAQSADMAIADVPLLRLATPSDIANLAMFLASPYASYISGAVISCDGGGAADSVKPAVERAGHALLRKQEATA
jgi:NAD(P)-dependent dehydrogenase (short-subunit alcohol dehydrogenase family)